MYRGLVTDEELFQREMSSYEQALKDRAHNSLGLVKPLKAPVSDRNSYCTWTAALSRPPANQDATILMDKDGSPTTYEAIEVAFRNIQRTRTNQPFPVPRYFDPKVLDLGGKDQDELLRGGSYLDLEYGTVRILTGGTNQDRQENARELTIKFPASEFYYITTVGEGSLTCQSCAIAFFTQHPELESVFLIARGSTDLHMAYCHVTKRTPQGPVVAVQFSNTVTKYTKPKTNGASEAVQAVMEFWRKIKFEARIWQVDALLIAGASQFKDLDETKYNPQKASHLIVVPPGKFVEVPKEHWTKNDGTNVVEEVLSMLNSTRVYLGSREAS